MTTNKKISFGVAATIATASVFFYLRFNAAKFVGVYGNHPSTYIYTDSGINGEIAWLKKNSINAFVSYRLTGIMKSNPLQVRKFAIELRRAGINTFGVAYSDTSIISLVKRYNEGCLNDSMKVNTLWTEYEQYQTGQSRPYFYTLIRTVGNYCKANNISHIPYQGWGSQQDYDSIRVNSTAIALHCYRQHHLYSNVGYDAFGYLKGRLSMLAQSNVNTNQTTKFPVLVIYSVENPDSTKEQFGYKYFKTHGFGDVHSSLKVVYPLRATTLMKENIDLGGYQIFVEDQAKKIK